MIQRVLESSEFEESEVTGEAVLPTIFSITSPFSEAGTVGLTAGIVGGFAPDSPAYLKDEDENSTKSLKSVSPTEMVLWVSPQGPIVNDEVLVTLDVQHRRLSVWRYVYVKPKDIPIALGRARARGNARKRMSMSGVVPGSRRHSTMFAEPVDHRDRLPPLSPSTRSREQSPSSDFPELRPLIALPGMPPSLSTTTTMASLVSQQGSSSTAPWSPRGRRNSLTRIDLSVTMDRMVLGGRVEADTLAPIEHGRMKAAYWMEKLHSEDISDVE
jgi:anaphase-promoting complex subunit 1